MGLKFSTCDSFRGSRFTSEHTLEKIALYKFGSNKNLLNKKVIIEREQNSFLKKKKKNTKIKIRIKF